MKKSARSFTVIVSILAIGLVAAFAATAGAKTKAKAKKDSGTAYVHVVKQNGSTEYAAGYTYDKLFGTTATTYVTSIQTGTSGTVTVVAHKVTLYTPKGSFVGTGTASDNLTTGAITGGKLNLNKGTGAEKGHTFKGTFTGSYNATTGVFVFNYKGTVK
jgi:hypothetical protein